MGGLLKQPTFTPEEVAHGNTQVRNFQLLWLDAYKSLSPSGGCFKKFHFLVHLFWFVSEYGAFIHLGQYKLHVTK